jgi:hypothetical protein
MNDEQKAWAKYGQDLTSWYLSEMCRVSMGISGNTQGLSDSGPNGPPPPPPGDDG